MLARQVDLIKSHLFLIILFQFTFILCANYFMALGHWKCILVVFLLWKHIFHYFLKQFLWLFKFDQIHFSKFRGSNDPNMLYLTKLWGSKKVLSVISFHVYEFLTKWFLQAGYITLTFLWNEINNIIMAYDKYFVIQVQDCYIN